MNRSAPPRRVTIIDVARHANVSTTTVSKVLRNAYGASPVMQERVRQAIAELGYRPHAAARGMRGQTYTLGVMLLDIRNPFFADVLDGVNDHLTDTEYQVLLGRGYNGEAAEERITDIMLDHQTPDPGLRRVGQQVGPDAGRSGGGLARHLPALLIGRPSVHGTR